MFDFFKRKEPKKSIVHIVFVPKDKISEFYKLYDLSEACPVKKYQYEFWSFVEQSICKETIEKLVNDNPEYKTYIIRYEVDTKDITHPSIKITVSPKE